LILVFLHSQNLLLLFAHRWSLLWATAFLG
jgi:hypothetical protein